ncbi:MAG: methyltransferase domain-containing protein [Clostridia bacterium]|nr:methyltransferase domain-containing protein [Clostridia bacterium]
MSIIICPVCGKPLNTKEKPCLCEVGHSFDRAKEGYLNLLLSNQHKSRHPGDSPQSCKARRAFLSSGYYEPLAIFVASLLSDGTVLDACCGEGYYTSFMTGENRAVYGFDIAKDMIKLASKRDKSAEFFVAGINNIPVEEKSVDTLTHIFAPVNDSEFSRILKDDGIMIDVIPGADHLMGLKSILYDEPYKNPVSPLDSSLFRQQDEKTLKYDITAEGEDVMNLFHMTPYAYKTALTGEKKLAQVSSLRTSVEFVVRIYKKSIR